MSWTEKHVAWVLGSLLLTTSVKGVSDDAVMAERSYRVIVDRNPFGLKPLPPPPTNNIPVVSQPKDEIFLTGITSFGSLRAFFMTKAPQGKNPEYYSLGVDEKKDDLEILAIDIAAKSVRVRNSGVETVMTFDSNGIKPPAMAALPPPGGHGAPPAPGTLPTPRVASLPGGPVTARSVTTISSVPGVTPIIPAGGSSRIRTIPSRSVRTRATPMDPAMAQRYGLTPEGEPNPQAQPDPNAAIQDVLIMELQKRANPDIVFPPTPLP